MSARQTATLRVRRGEAGAPARHQDFEVSFEPGASVLDGLMQIRESDDPTLAVRFSCISANVCKECTMLIDGKVEYACVARLKPGLTLLAPLPGKRVLRDLVTDTLSPRERPDD